MQTNRSTKRVWSALTLTAFAAASVVGCSQGSDSGSSPSAAPSATAEATSAPSAKPEAPLDLTLMLPIFKTNFPKDDSPVALEIEKRTNTNIHFEWVPNSSYPDKVNITLASGKLPHIMYIPDRKAPSFVSAARQGAFWELTPYLKDYPNLSKANPIILNNTSIDGKLYGIYRGRPLGRNGIVYRKDWLEAVGLQPPKTIDDFYNMLKAFATKDPDKNGKNDTYGMVLVKWTGQWASGFDIISKWFGAPNGWGTGADGKLVPAHETPEYFEALKFMKKLYDEKLINSDFAVMDSAKWNDPVVNGQAGVIVDVIDAAARIDDRIKAAKKAAGETVADDQHFMDVLGSVAGPKGNFTQPTSGFAGMLAISKSAVKTEAELKRVLKFLDQLNEEDLSTLAGYGLEGKHYKLVDGFVERSTDAALLESEVEGLNQMLPFIPEDRTKKVKQTPLRIKQDATIKANESIVVPNPAEPLISEVYSQKGNQLDNIINDARIKYIVGQTNDAGWQSALQLWRKSGGDDLVKEINELYDKTKT
ncbi:extracellular solute-binding protein [Paenibacillus thermoaerophilus]|uniref:Extracellular solute-binding protein n=1 Tax=Paenibacillus thermoaerophilus TaxID=1215385 RepID=A0ABW2V3U0_9BACL|nr:extracellular solute-binding protein [Paenibacillus thermoaerophilus]TMV17409.1 extracellular solute-binding protein [Paenibacillus thermoaerophilus]